MKFFENEKNKLKIGKEKKRKKGEIRIFLTVFPTLFRLDESHSGGKGYGLGLSIAKEIVTMHKGEIKVESEKKHIHFIVFLPWIR